MVHNITRWHEEVNTPEASGGGAGGGLGGDAANKQERCHVSVHV